VSLSHCLYQSPKLSEIIIFLTVQTLILLKITINLEENTIFSKNKIKCYLGKHTEAIKILGEKCFKKKTYHFRTPPKLHSELIARQFIWILRVKIIPFQIKIVQATPFLNELLQCHRAKNLVKERLLKKKRIIPCTPKLDKPIYRLI